MTLESHNSELTGLSFSENGYFLATSAAKDNSVNIVDLRKSKILKKINLEDKYEVKSVKFDYSGSYLGVSGTSLILYNVKTGDIFKEFKEHTDLVTDLAFGKDCEYIASSSLDRDLKIYSH